MSTNAPESAPAPAAPRPSIGRSLAAVALGFMVVGGLAVLVDAGLRAAGVFSPGTAMSTPQYAVAMLHRLVFLVLGGYVTARAAPAKPLAHAVVLGFAASVIAVVGAGSVARQAPGTTPLWYPLGIIGATMPCCGLGGVLGMRR